MKRLRIGIVRYASVGRAIAQALGVNPPPDCRIGRGRITFRFRQSGASRWPENDRIQYALQVATVARNLLGADTRRTVRRRVNRAIVIVFEDSHLDRGCDITSKWQCIIPSGHSSS
jgi:hypothetical protein